MNPEGYLFFAVFTAESFHCKVLRNSLHLIHSFSNVFSDEKFFLIIIFSMGQIEERQKRK